MNVFAMCGICYVCVVYICYVCLLGIFVTGVVFMWCVSVECV